MAKTTLRDEFAIAIIQGALASREIKLSDFGTNWSPELVYRIANEMVEEATTNWEDDVE